MKMTVSEHSHQQTQEGKNASVLRFVADLEDEQDYWMSLTDAARITRTSESMARRWVNSGRLPVKQGPVGINQRTRLVRASDVARIRPIIDPTAAITDDIHKLDLLSIPHQQARIEEEQRHLKDCIEDLQQRREQDVDEVRASLASLTKELQHQEQEWSRQLDEHRRHQQQALDLQSQQQKALTTQLQDHARTLEKCLRELHDLREQEEGHQHTLEQFRASIVGLFDEAQHEIQRQLNKIDEESRNRINHLHQEMATLLQQHEERLQRIVDEMQEYMHQGHEQIKHDLTELRQAYATHVEAITLVVAQQKQDVEIVLAQHGSELVGMSERVGRMEQQADLRVVQDEEAQQRWHTYQEQIEAQDQQLQTLIALLQEEREARQALTKQFVVQQEQHQVLRHQLEGIKTPNAEREI